MTTATTEPHEAQKSPYYRHLDACGICRRARGTLQLCDTGANLFRQEQERVIAATPSVQCDRCKNWVPQDTVKVQADVTFCSHCQEGFLDWVTTASNSQDTATKEDYDTCTFESCPFDLPQPHLISNHPIMPQDTASSEGEGPPKLEDRERAAEVMQGVNLHAFSDVTYDQLQSRIAAALAATRIHVRDAAEVAAVDAVMRHDVMFVNESLRRAIAKDVKAAIRNKEQP